MRAITFNGFNLQDATYFTGMVQGIDAQREVDTDAPFASISNGSYIRDKKFRSKKIVLRTMIRGTSIEDVEQKNDALKRAVFKGIKGNLDIEYAGATRRWVATVEDINPTRLRGMTREYEIEFSAEGFGFEVTPVVLSYTAETAGTISKTINVLGSFETKPIYIIQFNEIDSVSRVSLTNITTNQTLEINANFSFEQTLMVDTEKETIRLDGEDIEPDGVFPILLSGLNDIEFTVVSESHNVDVEIEYYKRYV